MWGIHILFYSSRRRISAHTDLAGRSLARRSAPARSFHMVRTLNLCVFLLSPRLHSEFMSGAAALLPPPAPAPAPLLLRRWLCAALIEHLLPLLREERNVRFGPTATL